VNPKHSQMGITMGVGVSKCLESLKQQQKCQTFKPTFHYTIGKDLKHA